MRKLLNKPWFVGLLALSAIGFVVHAVLPARETPPAPEPAVTETAEEPAREVVAAVPSTPAAIRAAIKELNVGTSFRDPFAARAKALGQTERIPEPDITETVKVSAVWLQGENTFVLINNRIFKVGQRIGRCTVDSASREGVWISHWKGRDFVSIGSAFTLVTPARQAATLSLTSGG